MPRIPIHTKCTNCHTWKSHLVLELVKLKWELGFVFCRCKPVLYRPDAATSPHGLHPPLPLFGDVWWINYAVHGFWRFQRIIQPRTSLPHSMWFCCRTSCSKTWTCIPQLLVRWNYWWDRVGGRAEAAAKGGYEISGINDVWYPTKLEKSYFL